MRLQLPVPRCSLTECTPEDILLRFEEIKGKVQDMTSKGPNTRQRTVLDITITLV